MFDCDAVVIATVGVVTLDVKQEVEAVAVVAAVTGLNNGEPCRRRASLDVRCDVTVVSVCVELSRL